MAVRIAGVNIPNEKRVEIALTYIFGIGRTVSLDIINQAKIDPSVRVKDLKDEEVDKLRAIIEKSLSVEGDLRRKVSSNIKRLKDIKCYRGDRHAKSLPCRGQRTKTNSRTSRGNKRVTLGSGRNKAGNQKT